jgi:hypothetical protein
MPWHSRLVDTSYVVAVNKMVDEKSVEYWPPWKLAMLPARLSRKAVLRSLSVWPGRVPLLRLQVDEHRHPVATPHLERWRQPNPAGLSLHRDAANQEESFRTHGDSLYGYLGS